MPAGLENVICALNTHPPLTWQGHIVGLEHAYITVAGLNDIACIGDRVSIRAHDGSFQNGEIVAIIGEVANVYPEGSALGLKRGDTVRYLGKTNFAPDDGWIGRVVDPDGHPLDGRTLLGGTKNAELSAKPPAASLRRGMGRRVETSMALFDTILPIARGQRVGLFAGSGVGKTTLLGRLATGVSADVIIIALVGERGRELNEFVERVIGPEAMKRTIVVAATSDQSATIRRRCAWSAMTVAEYFRDTGQHVLLILDSVTRFAEAHREIAVAVGEGSVTRGFPASTSTLISGLSERAGPGTADQGDITAIFSVLVSGSDMEEPVADMLRGVLDGHIVLDRSIAEKGRFPAVDVLRSVSRSLPEAASDTENELIARTRSFLNQYEQSELMVRAGLYTPGNDPLTDAAINSMPELELFFCAPSLDGISGSFARLYDLLDLSAANRE